MFQPQTYNIPDRPGLPFIDPNEIRRCIESVENPTTAEIERVTQRSLSGKRLSMDETAVLLNATGPEQWETIFRAAGQLKQEIYGERIVLFAPLYIGNKCVNDCSYCGFRSSNRDAFRRTLTHLQVKEEVLELERTGQKRLIMVFGEHPVYDPQYIADTARTVYSVSDGNGRINRVNINAAPLDAEGFRIVKEAGIGTYQVFQETYDPTAYVKYHGRGPKSDYGNRLTSLDRAMEAGIDDVGLGVLLGLADWKFEVLSLVRHTNHLEACFGVGPHTISFPRIQNALNLDRSILREVPDETFRKLVAVLRLAVPYTGLILTAREPASLRNELISCGITQIDAGTNLEIGGYSEKRDGQQLDREQFELSDDRSLHNMAEWLVANGQVPSFCTACYRKGRTGEHFMKFSTTGGIKAFCGPNALLTFAGYLYDHASGELKETGLALIREKLAGIHDPKLRTMTDEKLDRIARGERDLLF